MPQLPLYIEDVGPQPAFCPACKEWVERQCDDPDTCKRRDDRDAFVIQLN